MFPAPASRFSVQIPLTRKKSIKGGPPCSTLQLRIPRVLVDKSFSHKCCLIHILPIFIIVGAAFFWISWASSDNWDRQIFYITKNTAKFIYFKDPSLKTTIWTTFSFSKFYFGGNWGNVKFWKRKIRSNRGFENYIL